MWSNKHQRGASSTLLPLPSTRVQPMTMGVDAPWVATRRNISSISSLFPSERVVSRGNAPQEAFHKQETPRNSHSRMSWHRCNYLPGIIFANQYLAGDFSSSHSQLPTAVALIITDDANEPVYLHVHVCTNSSWNWLASRHSEYPDCVLWLSSCLHLYAPRVHSSRPAIFCQ